jgi:hypothetical protein
MRKRYKNFNIAMNIDEFYYIRKKKKCGKKTGLMLESSKKIKTILGINSLKQTLN